MNICRHCKINEGTLVDSTTYHNDKIYKYYSCTSCNTKRFRKYYHTPSGEKSVKKSVKKYGIKNRVRQGAWTKAQSIPLGKCSIVGCESKYKTHRHHPDPNKPLEVVMLCPKHHRQADVLLKKLQT